MDLLPPQLMLLQFLSLWRQNLWRQKMSSLAAFGLWFVLRNMNKLLHVVVIVLIIFILVYRDRSSANADLERLAEIGQNCRHGDSDDPLIRHRQAISCLLNLGLSGQPFNSLAYERPEGRAYTPWHSYLDDSNSMLDRVSLDNNNRHILEGIWGDRTRINSIWTLIDELDEEGFRQSIVRLAHEEGQQGRFVAMAILLGFVRGEDPVGREASEDFRGLTGKSFGRGVELALSRVVKDGPQWSKAIYDAFVVPVGGTLARPAFCPASTDHTPGVYHSMISFGLNWAGCKQDLVAKDLLIGSRSESRFRLLRYN